MIKNQSPSEYIAEFITQVLTEAITLRASDVHFESFGHQVDVRFRIDGELRLKQSLCPSLYPGIIARLKTLAQLDISQTLRPQDGRLQFIANQAHHIRIHCCPTLYHEKIVLRFLGDAKTVLSLTDLGLTDTQLGHVLQALNRMQGLLICTGPTGSGKSMTLYALLKLLHTRSLAITTIEDPVEIPIPGISQIPLHPKQGMDTTQILKSVLRQDPDVIMVGEIRDEETAHLAIRASLTGHLVLTTLHTRDCASAVTRLINMHVAPYDLADALSLVMAQRLVRALCQRCGGQGCEHCVEGRKGRIGVFECLTITPVHQSLIRQQHSLTVDFTLSQAYEQHIASYRASPGEVIT